MHLAVIADPIEIGRELGEIRDLHFVDQLVGIAPLHAGLRSPGHGGFYPHHGFGILLCSGGRVADQLKYFLHVQHIALARFFGLGIILCVVVAIGHAQPALVDVGNHRFGVVGVLRGTGGEEQGTGIGVAREGKLQTRHHGRDVPGGMDVRNLIQFGLNRRNATLLDRGFIHARGVEVTDLLLDRIPLLIRLGRLFQHSAQEDQIVLIELSVHRPGRLIGRDRILLLPSTAGVAIKVHAGIDGFVHGGNIEARAVGQSRLGRWGLGVRRQATKHNRDAEEEEFFSHIHL